MEGAPVISCMRRWGPRLLRDCWRWSRWNGIRKREFSGVAPAAGDGAARTSDVVVIGGGLIGSSVAYHLAARDPGISVTVLEKDTTFKYASSSRSAGGIRLQFSLPENVKISMYGMEFLKQAHELLRTSREDDNVMLDMSPSTIGYVREIPASLSIPFLLIS